MHGSIVAVIAATCYAIPSSAPLVFLRQSKPFSASATVLAVSGPSGLVVHLRNDSDAPLEAWALQIQYNVRGGSPKNTYPGVDTASDEAEPGTPGRGPILPGETRDMHCAVEGEALDPTVSIRMLIFANGTVEGDRGLAESVFVLRDRQAEVLGFWIDALTAATGVSVQQARIVLERASATEAVRIRAARGSADGQSQYDTVTSLLATPDDLILSQIAEVKKRFERVWERQTRHRRGRQRGYSVLAKKSRA